MTDDEVLGSIPNLKKSTRETFPSKLHLILENYVANNYHHIISWIPNGRSFKICDETLFAKVILLKYLFITKQ